MSKKGILKLAMVLVFIVLFTSIVFGYYEVNEIEIDEQSISNNKKELVLTREDNKWGAIDKEGKEVIPFIYDEIVNFGWNNTTEAKKDNKWGVIDKEGKEVIPFIYDEISYFDLGNIKKAKKDNKWGAIDKEGKEVIPFIYDEIVIFGQMDPNFASVKKNGKWGLVNNEGNEIVECKYDGISKVIDSKIAFAFTMKDSVMSWEYIFINSGMALPGEYYIEGAISDNLAISKENNKFRLINDEGKEILPSIYDKISEYSGAFVSEFSEGFVIVKKDNKYGIFDYSGKEIVPIEYDEIEYYFDKVVKIKRNNKYGFVNLENKKIISCVYDQVDNYDIREEKIGVKKNGKWGIINSNGEEIISFKYNNELYFYEGLACINEEGKYGYINENEEVVIPCIYDDVKPFSMGVAIVMINDKYGLINKKGEEVLPCIYDNIDYHYWQEIIVIKKEEKYGFVNIESGKVFPCIYDYLGYFDKKPIIVKKGDKYGLINTSGEEVLACIYDEINDGEDYNYNYITKYIGKKSEKTYLIDVKEKEECVVTLSKIYINEKEVPFEAYNIGGYNYFKLRDIAYALNDTNKKFQVEWNEKDNRIEVIRNKDYIAVGNELKKININDENKEGTRTTSFIDFDGLVINMELYNIDGYNYVKLRDILKIINSEVIYDENTKKIYINTNNGYVE